MLESGGTFGWPAALPTLGFFSQDWDKLNYYTAVAGENQDAIDSGELIYTCVDIDRDHPEHEPRSFTDACYGPQSYVETDCTFGRFEDCAAKLQAYIYAGAKTVIVSPSCPTQNK